MVSGRRKRSALPPGRDGAVVRPKSKGLAKQPKSPEINNDLGDHFSHLMERFNNRITLANLRLGERYVQTELHILLHFRLGDSEEYVAHFKRRDPMPHESALKNGGVLALEVGDPLSLTGKDGMSLAASPDGEEKSVFVDICQSVDMTKVFPCPSDVRLDTLDGFYGVFPQSRFYSFKFGFKVAGRIANDEFGIAALNCISIGDFNQRIDRMIQTRPDIVDGVSDEKRKVLGDGRDLTQAIEAISSIRISLESDRVRIRLSRPEGTVSSFKIEDVLVGPFCF